MSEAFCKMVEKAFRFFETKHGFKVVESSDRTVVYETCSLKVWLFHDDQRSFEVGFGISQTDEKDQPSFRFDVMLRSLNVPSSEWPSGYAALTPEKAQMLVQRMSQIAERYAAPLLDGDGAAWAALRNQRQADCIAYAASSKLVHAKEAAEQAWAARDYLKVVRELNSVKELLGKTDLEKLAYAKRAVGE